MAGSPIKAERRRIWTEAINKALAARVPSRDIIEALQPVAEQLIEQALSGNVNALKELADRLEGKATEFVTLTGDVKELSDAQLHAIAARGGEGTAGEESGAGEPAKVH